MQLLLLWSHASSSSLSSLCVEVLARSARRRQGGLVSESAFFFLLHTTHNTCHVRAGASLLAAATTHHPCCLKNSLSKFHRRQKVTLSTKCENASLLLLLFFLDGWLTDASRGHPSHGIGLHVNETTKKKS